MTNVLNDPAAWYGWFTYEISGWGESNPRIHPISGIAREPA
jgi:hypothetical protein